MIESLLDIIFPKTCLICGKQENCYICSSCLQLFDVKAHIIKSNKEYNYLIYLLDYKNKNRKDMLGFKFYDKAYMSEYFIELLIKDKKVCKFLKEFDIIIPVPTTENKKKIRGYNQTELLAKSLGKNLNITVKNNLLEKVKENKTQSTLSKKDRTKNVENVFKVSNLVSNKNIILIDDIFTTGSTIEECSKELRKNGANKICALVICKD